jgi:hypothetical protein
MIEGIDVVVGISGGGAMLSTPTMLFLLVLLLLQVKASTTNLDPGQI